MATYNTNSRSSKSAKKSGGYAGQLNKSARFGGSFNNVNPALTQALAMAAMRYPGYAEAASGQERHVKPGTNIETPNHTKGYAMDMGLYDEAGNLLDNGTNPTTAPAYLSYGQMTNAAMKQTAPQLPFRAGVAFGDNMHYDVTPGQAPGAMAKKYNTKLAPDLSAASYLDAFAAQGKLNAKLHPPSLSPAPPVPDMIKPNPTLGMGDMDMLSPRNFTDFSAPVADKRDGVGRVVGDTVKGIGQTLRDIVSPPVDPRVRALPTAPAGVPLSAPQMGVPGNYSVARGADARSIAMAHFTSPEGGGYTPTQAAGIVGNLMGESLMKPGIVGDKGKAQGIAQWHGNRFGPLSAWAEKQGLDPNSLQGQLAMVTHELKTTEKGPDAKIRAATTVEGATRAALSMERPKHWEDAKPGVVSTVNYDKRVEHAKSAISHHAQGLPMNAAEIAAATATAPRPNKVTSAPLPAANAIPDSRELNPTFGALSNQKSPPNQVGMLGQLYSKADQLAAAAQAPAKVAAAAGKPAAGPPITSVASLSPNKASLPSSLLSPGTPNYAMNGIGAYGMGALSPPKSAPPITKMGITPPAVNKPAPSAPVAQDERSLTAAMGYGGQPGLTAQGMMPSSSSVPFDKATKPTAATFSGTAMAPTTASLTGASGMSLGETLNSIMKAPAAAPKAPAPAMSSVPVPVARPTMSTAVAPPSPPPRPAEAAAGFEQGDGMGPAPLSSALSRPLGTNGKPLANPISVTPTTAMPTSAMETAGTVAGVAANTLGKASRGAVAGPVGAAIGGVYGLATSLAKGPQYNPKSYTTPTTKADIVPQGAPSILQGAIEQGLGPAPAGYKYGYSAINPGGIATVLNNVEGTNGAIKSAAEGPGPFGALGWGGIPGGMVSPMGTGRGFMTGWGSAPTYSAAPLPTAFRPGGFAPGSYSQSQLAGIAQRGGGSGYGGLNAGNYSGYGQGVHIGSGGAPSTGTAGLY